MKPYPALYPTIFATIDVGFVYNSMYFVYAGTKPQVYFLGLIDVLTIYGARKRAAHAAKTMKHGVSFILFYSQVP